jgi:hypothetical protein
MDELNWGDAPPPYLWDEKEEELDEDELYPPGLDEEPPPGMED